MKPNERFYELYTVEKDGRIYSKRNSIYLKTGYDKYGYKSCTVSYDGKRYIFKVHRLVAITYIPNPLSKPTVNHINGIKDDNRVETLEWATYREQQLTPVTYKKIMENAKRTDYKAMNAKSVERMKKKVIFKYPGGRKEFESLSACARFYGRDVSTAYKCLHRGYKFLRKGFLEYA
jgi:hypothetical protein